MRDLPASKAVAALHLGLLIPAGAKGLVTRSGENHHPDFGIIPGILKRLDHLVHGLRAKGVHDLGPVDDHLCDPVLFLEKNVLKTHVSSLFYLLVIISQASNISVACVDTPGQAL